MTIDRGGGSNNRENEDNPFVTPLPASEAVESTSAQPLEDEERPRAGLRGSVRDLE